MMERKIFLAIFLSLLCYVTAKKGTHNEIVENLSDLKAAPKIGPSLNLTTLPLSPCKIRATWNCKNCGSLTYDHYVVHWEESEDSNVNDTAPVKKSLNTYEIDQLKSNKNYTIYVEAVDSDSEPVIDPSDDSEAATSKGDPNPVTGFKVGEVTDSKIPLSWDNTTNECPIEGFHIVWNGAALWDQYRHAGGEYTTDGKSKTSYTISNLMPYAHYDISIQELATDHTQGDNKTDEATTDEREASAPPFKTFTLSSSSINVTWEEPSSANGVLTGYFVQWVPEDDENNGGNATTSEDEFVYTITDLVACARYDISVAAINGAGIGNKNTETNSTDEEKSPAPENLNCTYDPTLDPVQITITWDLIDTNQTKCPIDHYGISYRKEILWNGEVTVTKNTVDNSTTSSSISNLPPYTQYDIEVSAYTSKQQGNISTCTPVVTPEEEPGLPIILGPAIGTETNTSYTLVWNDPLDKNGALQGFNVSLYNNETNDIYQDTVEYNDFTDAFYTYKFSDLVPEIDYTVGISAVNGFGYGDEETHGFILEEYENEEML